MSPASEKSLSTLNESAIRMRSDLQTRSSDSETTVVDISESCHVQESISSSALHEVQAWPKPTLPAISTINHFGPLTDTKLRRLNPEAKIFQPMSPMRVGCKVGSAATSSLKFDRRGSTSIDEFGSVYLNSQTSRSPLDCYTSGLSYEGCVNDDTEDASWVESFGSEGFTMATHSKPSVMTIRDFESRCKDDTRQPRNMPLSTRYAETSDVEADLLDLKQSSSPQADLILDVTKSQTQRARHFLRLNPSAECFQPNGSSYALETWRELLSEMIDAGDVDNAKYYLNIFSPGMFGADLRPPTASKPVEIEQAMLGIATNESNAARPELEGHDSSSTHYDRTLMDDQVRNISVVGDADGKTYPNTSSVEGIEGKSDDAHIEHTKYQGICPVETDDDRPARTRASFEDDSPTEERDEINLDDDDDDEQDGEEDEEEEYICGVPFRVGDKYYSANFTLPDLPIEMINEYISIHSEVRAGIITGDPDTLRQEDLKAKQEALYVLKDRHENVPQGLDDIIFRMSSVRCALAKKQPDVPLSAHSALAHHLGQRMFLTESLKAPRAFDLVNVMPFTGDVPVLENSDWNDYHHLNTLGDFLPHGCSTAPELSMYMALALSSSNRRPVHCQSSSHYYRKLVVSANACKLLDPVKVEDMGLIDSIRENIEDLSVLPFDQIKQLQDLAEVAYPPLGSWQYDDYGDNPPYGKSGQIEPGVSGDNADNQYKTRPVKGPKPRVLLPGDDFVSLDGRDLPDVHSLFEADQKSAFMPQVPPRALALRTSSPLRLMQSFEGEIESSTVEACVNVKRESVKHNAQDLTLLKGSCDAGIEQQQSAMKPKMTTEPAIQPQTTAQTTFIDLSDKAVLASLTTEPLDYRNNHQQLDVLDHADLQQATSLMNLFLIHEVERFSTERATYPCIYTDLDVPLIKPQPLYETSAVRQPKKADACKNHKRLATPSQDKREKRNHVVAAGLELPSFLAPEIPSKPSDPRVPKIEPFLHPPSRPKPDPPQEKRLLVPNSKKKMSVRKPAGSPMTTPQRDAANRKAVAASPTTQRQAGICEEVVDSMPATSRKKHITLKSHSEGGKATKEKPKETGTRTKTGTKTTMNESITRSDRSNGSTRHPAVREPARTTKLSANQALPQVARQSRTMEDEEEEVEEADTGFSATRPLLIYGLCLLIGLWQITP